MRSDDSSPAARHRLGRPPSPGLVRAVAAVAPVITVIGDAMLDTWIYGESHRLAREAPAPVVERREEVSTPGGAANTAMNLAALGARVRFVGLTGTDDAGRALCSHLRVAGIDTTHLLVRSDVTTVTKTRIVVGDQVIARLDDVDRVPSQAAVDDLEREALSAASGAAALVVCDYGSAVHASSLSSLLSAMRVRPLTIVDSHDPLHWAEVRPTVVTPNAQEAERVLGRGLGVGSERIAEARRSIDQLRRALGARSAVLTLDRDGTIALDADGALHRTRAHPVPERRASGAGDTFVAGLTVALAAELPLALAADLAQAAADVVVGQEGTSLCSVDDLALHVGEHGTLQDASALSPGIAEAREAGRRVVLASSACDMLGADEAASLARARALGDVLVVAVEPGGSGDEQIADRATVLTSLSAVDHVVRAEEPSTLLFTLQPDVVAVLPGSADGPLARRAAVEANRGRLEVVDLGAESVSAVDDRRGITASDPGPRSASGQTPGRSGGRNAGA